MFEQFSMLGLQEYWWFLVSLLGALLIFLMFVQGGQTLFWRLSHNETQLSMLVNAMGRKWELTFTTLVTFGGAFFASFPLFYSVSFGGAYWLWTLILIVFVIQAVSYEFRNKANNLLGSKGYEILLYINGLFGTILIGVAVATLFTGAPFSLNESNVMTWHTPYRGLEALVNWKNLVLGVSIFYLSRMLGNLYFMNVIDDEELLDRMHNRLRYDVIPFLAFFVLWIIVLFTMTGYNINSEGLVELQPYKYLHNFQSQPWLFAILIFGVFSILMGVLMSVISPNERSIWYAGFGTVAVVLCLLLSLGLNHTVFYPSTVDLQSSLTIENASSSRFTLIVMSYVSLGIPVVLGYIWYVWRKMTKKDITAEEIENTDDKY